MNIINIWADVQNIKEMTITMRYDLFFVLKCVCYYDGVKFIEIWVFYDISC